MSKLEKAITINLNALVNCPEEMTIKCPHKLSLRAFISRENLMKLWSLYIFLKLQWFYLVGGDKFVTANCMSLNQLK